MIQIKEVAEGNVFLTSLKNLQAAKRALKKVTEFMVFAIQICPVCVNSVTQRQLKSFSTVEGASNV